MGDASFQQIACGNCGAALDFALKPETRQPCPSCGSMKRHFSVTFSETVTVRDSMAWKARHPGPGRPFHEGKVGSDLHRDSGEWREIERVIDREGDRYRERIARPDGEVVRDVDEPLTQHRGRGSARRGSRDSDPAEPKGS